MRLKSVESTTSEAHGRVISLQGLAESGLFS